MAGNSNSGRKPRYLTIERFEKWVMNDYWHTKLYARASFWVSLVILAAIIVKFITG